MGRYGRLVVLLLLVLMAGVHSSFRYLIKPYAISEIRPALEYVEASQQPGDRLFIYKWAVPAFDFYTRWHARPLHFLDKTPVLEEGPVEGERAWLVYTHLLSKETRGEMEADLRRFGETGALREAFTSKGTAVWLWSKKAQ
ncbi:MAG: hypothetical protein IPH04_11830 [Saprospirales bacterium]|nr:hypothetical protein [Saprospirales bacterium]